MPFKLISGILLAVFVAVVTGFNLGNNTDVWFFHTFEQLPVVGVILGSFIFGVLITIPFCMFADHKSKKSIEEKLLTKIKKQEEKAAKEAEKIKSKVTKDKKEEKKVDNKVDGKVDNKEKKVESKSTPEKIEPPKVESNKPVESSKTTDENSTNSSSNSIKETESKKFLKFPLLNK